MSVDPNLTEQDYELLSAFIDGMLSDEEREVVQARLMQEPALRRELAALRQTVALLRQMPPLKAPRNFTLTQEMLSQGQTQTQTPPDQATPRKRPPIVLPILSVLSAAAAVLMLAFGFLLLGSDQSPTMMMALSTDAPEAGTQFMQTQVAVQPSATPTITITQTATATIATTAEADDAATPAPQADIAPEAAAQDEENQDEEAQDEEAAITALDAASVDDAAPAGAGVFEFAVTSVMPAPPLQPTIIKEVVTPVPDALRSMGQAGTSASPESIAPVPMLSATPTHTPDADGTEVAQAAEIEADTALEAEAVIAPQMEIEARAPTPISANIDLYVITVLLCGVLLLLTALALGWLSLRRWRA